MDDTKESPGQKIPRIDFETLPKDSPLYPAAKAIISRHFVSLCMQFNSDARKKIQERVECSENRAALITGGRTLVRDFQQALIMGLSRIPVKSFQTMLDNSYLRRADHYAEVLIADMGEKWASIVLDQRLKNTVYAMIADEKGLPNMGKLIRATQPKP